MAKLTQEMECNKIWIQTTTSINNPNCVDFGLMDSAQKAIAGTSMLSQVLKTKVKIVKSFFKRVLLNPHFLN